jgi:hypothetical protein
VAGRNAGYTHRDWRVAATDMRDALEELLAPALEHMHAGLLTVEGGRTQVTEAARFISLVRELGAEGTRLLGDHDARLRRVGEEQAAIGHDEVAGDKRYNQR